MNIIRKITVIGGDRRSLFCAECFAKAGFECAVYGFEKEPPHFAVRAATLSDALNESTAVILPLPTTDTDGKTVFAPFSNDRFTLHDVVSALPREAVVFCGNPTERDRKILSGHNIENYAKDEGFMLRGRIPTAEGALQIAMQQTEKTIFGSEVLVCGGGRIGRYLAGILSSMGANVTLSVRKREDRISALQHGYTVIRTSEIRDCPTSFDVIFNTIPFPVLEEKVLKKLRGTPLIIELASKPYGAVFTPFRIQSEIRKIFGRISVDFSIAACYNRVVRNVQIQLSIRRIFS